MELEQRAGEAPAAVSVQVPTPQPPSIVFRGFGGFEHIRLYHDGRIDVRGRPCEADPELVQQLRAWLDNYGFSDEATFRTVDDLDDLELVNEASVFVIRSTHQASATAWASYLETGAYRSRAAAETALAALAAAKGATTRVHEIWTNQTPEVAEAAADDDAPVAYPFWEGWIDRLVLQRDS